MPLAHCIGDDDAVHPLCSFGRVLHGATTVVISGKGVRTATTGFNSAHAAHPLPTGGCDVHVGVPLPSDASKTVFAEGNGVMRMGDAVSDAVGKPPCTFAMPPKVNKTVFVGS
tara:strand:- start:104 stop:442 length:339 start_codon:yes stop_codon:yes gene_type:complete